MDRAARGIELLVGSNAVTNEAVAAIVREANQILAMTVASIKTLQNRNRGVVREPEAWLYGGEQQEDNVDRTNDNWLNDGEDWPDGQDVRET